MFELFLIVGLELKRRRGQLHVELVCLATYTFLKCMGCFMNACWALVLWFRLEQEKLTQHI